MEIEHILTELKTQMPEIELKENEPLSKHTTFKIGGPVRALLLPVTRSQLSSLIALLADYGEKPILIGNGSNVLADDAPISKLVIKTTGLSGIEVRGDEIKAECGALLSRIASEAQRNALSGLEFAHGIPGTLGGAIMMNAGAYGGEMKDVTVMTECLGANGECFCVTREEHEFAYRRSRFTESSEIILGSLLKLVHGDPDEIRGKMNEFAEKRRNSQPLDQPSAGSTFKRPKEGFAAALIDEAGLRGFTKGGAEVSSKHAGFVVNRGGANFADVMGLIEHVQKTVMRLFGIELEPEIRIIK